MNLGKNAENVLSRRFDLKRWHKIVLGLSILVVFCTVYILIKPAIAVSKSQEIAIREIERYTDIVSDPSDKRVLHTEKYGEGLMWSVVEDADNICTLVIYGEGELPELDCDAWNKDYKNVIRKVVFAEGVTPNKRGRFFLNYHSARNNYVEEIYCSTTMDRLNNKMGNLPRIERLFFAGDCKEICLDIFEERDKTLETLVLPAEVENITIDNYYAAKNKTIGRIQFYHSDMDFLADYGDYYRFDNKSSCLIKTKQSKEDEEWTGPKLIACTELYVDKLVLPEEITTIDKNSIKAKQVKTLVGENVVNAPSYPNVKELILPNCSLSTAENPFRWADKLEYLTVGETEFIPQLTENTTYVGLYQLNIKNPEKVEKFNDMALRYFYSLNLDLSQFTGLKEIGYEAVRDVSCLKNPTLYPVLEKIGDRAFAKCGRIEDTLIYNAANAQVGKKPSTVFEGTTFAKGVLGKEVKSIDATLLKAMRNACEDFQFEKDHYFDVVESEEKVECQLKPGHYYVDNQGVCYQLDRTKKKASLAYVPSGLNKLVVPIEQPSGYEIDSVNPYALKRADDLIEIDFEEPSNIKEIKDYAFSYAKNLEIINGKNQSLEIEKVLNKAMIGINAYYNTPKIKSVKEDVANKDLLEYEDHQVTLGLSAKPNNDLATEVLPNKDNKYVYYTGQSIPLSFSFSNASNVNSDSVVRIYIEFTTSKGKCSLKEGATHMIEDIAFSMRKANRPNTYIFESETIKKGHTFTSSFEVNYPVTESGGGKCRIWGQVLTTEEAENIGDKAPLNYDTKRYDLQWVTRPNKYKVEQGNDKHYNLSGSKASEELANIINLKHLIDLGTNDSGSDAEFRKLTYGNDPILSMKFSNNIKLDKDIKWNKEFIEALKEYKNNKSSDNIRINGGKILYKDSNGKMQCALKLLEQDYLDKYHEFKSNRDQNVSHAIEYNDDDSITIITNYSLTEGDYIYSKGHNHPKFTVAMENNAAYMQKPSNKDEVKEKFITIKTDLDTLYKYAGIISSPKTVTKFSGELQDSKIELKKERIVTPSNFDGNIKYRITTENIGVLPAKEFFITDTLNNNLYMTVEDLADLYFDMQKNKDWTFAVSIDNATCAKEPQLGEFESIDGISCKNSSFITSKYKDYSGVEVEKDKMKNEEVSPYNFYITPVIRGINKTTSITVTNKTTNKLMFEEDCTNSRSEFLTYVKSIFDQYGYIPDSNATYTIKFFPKREGHVFLGGGEGSFDISCSVKNTFMLLGMDRPGKYVHDTITIPQNSCEAEWGESDDSKKKATALEKTKEFDVNFEYRLCHEVRHKGKVINLKEGSVEPGSVLDISVNGTHFTENNMEVLPMITKLSGISHLLIPVEDANGDSLPKDLRTHKDDNGREYYILDKPGKYKNVKIRGQNFDTVEVDKNGETLIKGYWKDVRGIGVKHIQISTLVDKMEKDKGSTFTIISWLNDYGSRRLVASTSGTILNFKKKIVEKRGATPEDDVIVPNDYSGIKPADEVTYRIALRNTCDLPLTLTGSQIYDLLPDTKGLWKWDTENVKLEYVKEAGKDINLANENHYHITEPKDNERQSIIWDKDFAVNYTKGSSLYIYVTCKYPDKPLFDKYDEILGGAIIDNTLYVYNMMSQVYHNVISPGKVGFQKGVIFTGDSHGDAVNNNMRNIFSSGDDFNTGDGKYSVQYSSGMNNRRATFYLTISNEGNMPLILNEIEDILPEGFIFQGVNIGAEKHKFKLNTDAETYYYNGDVDATRSAQDDERKNLNGSIIKSDGKEYVVKNLDYHIDTKVGDFDPNGQKIKFNISKHSASDKTVSYDKRIEKYYLKKNEAITIVYQAQITGLAKYQDEKLVSGTLKKATNRASMCYSDPLNAGVKIDDKLDISCNKMYLLPTYSEKFDYLKDMPLNDGKGKVIDSSVAEGLGFSIDKDERQRLYSDVTLTRGDIKPGIEKSVSEIIKFNGKPEKYEGHAGYKDTIRWKLKLTNEGDSTIKDYAVEDTVEAPYFFKGKISIEYMSSPRVKSQDPEIVKKVLFKIGDIKKDIWGNEVVDIGLGNSSVVETYKIGSYREDIRIDKDENGNYKLWLKLPKPAVIPESGYCDVYIDTENISTKYKNHVYTNVANLRIDNLEYENSYIVHGQPLIDDEGPYIKAVSTATVLTAQQTNSTLKVEDTTTNSVAESDSEKDFLTLKAENDKLNYLLCVNNNSDHDIKGMTFMLNLPEVNDTYTFNADVGRGSQFKMELDRAENIKILVKEEGKEEKELKLRDDYQYLHSKKTTFNEDDWELNAEGWDSPSGYARSIKVMINDTCTIPANASVTVKIPVKVSNEGSVPGTFAWATFGYRYKTDISNEVLEAGPGKVGIRMFNLPTLTKKIAVGNKPITTEKDKYFRFVVYKGEKINNFPDDDAAKAEEALEKAGIEYTFYTMPVKRGESSETQILNSSHFVGEDFAHLVVLADNWNWKWENGETYTIQEIKNYYGDNEFVIEEFNNIKGNSYTFKYDSQIPQVITARNRPTNWAAKIVKFNKKKPEEKLKGAYFAIYGQDKKTAEANKAELQEFIASEKLNVEFEHVNGDDHYYLHDIRITDANGNLPFENLSDSKYALLEVKAPKDFVLDKTFRYVDADLATGTGNEAKLAIANIPVIILPKTGGGGKLAFLALGLGITGIAALIKLRKHKRA